MSEKLGHWGEGRSGGQLSFQALSLIIARRFSELGGCWADTALVHHVNHVRSLVCRQALQDEVKFHGSLAVVSKQSST